MEDLDREVVLGLTHHVPRLTLEHHPSSVMRVDDVVANLELARRGFQILDLGVQALLGLLQCCVCDVCLLK
jgi:hypothetical protein